MSSFTLDEHATGSHVHRDQYVDMQPDRKDLVFSDEGSIVIDVITGFVRWSWKVTITNNSDRTLPAGLLQVTLSDNEGYELDRSLARVHLEPGESRRVTGMGLLEEGVWNRHTEISFELK